jgi:hypothetical protein
MGRCSDTSVEAGFLLEPRKPVIPGDLGKSTFGDAAFSCRSRASIPMPPAQASEQSRNCRAARRQAKTSISPNYTVAFDRKAL